jgi:hypothetical protein
MPGDAGKSRSRAYLTVLNYVRIYKTSKVFKNNLNEFKKPT